MKKTIIFFLLIWGCILIKAQVPQGLNYQAIVRDGAGQILPDKALTVRISIQTLLSGGTLIWEETHSLTTNSFGMISFVIGNGTRTGGSSLLFSSIDWSLQTLYLKIEVDQGTGYIVMGTSQLWSVPYSMVAKYLGGPVDKIGIVGTTTDYSEALFEVKNQTGQTVFAVYSEGVRIYVDNGAKGVKGGFAIGGFGTVKSPSQQLFVVDPDSIRAYIDTNPVKGDKGVKGGFAIGGFGTVKAPGEEYLVVTRDSTRVNVREPAKGVKGGFAIGGFGGVKGTVTPFTSLTAENYFIGHESGMSNTTGLHNSFFGYNAGRSNTTGDFNIFIGEKSGYSNTNGWANIFMGDSAGYKNTSGFQNLFLGPWAGQENTTGYKNISLGFGAGAYNTIGYQNINIGHLAGLSTTTGRKNTFIGSGAGMNSIDTYQNVFIGNGTGQLCISGENNVFLGGVAGKMNLYGSNNIALGAFAGYFETGSNTLYIDNQKRADELDGKNKSLIYGIFDADPELQFLTINGNVGIGTISPSCKLQVGEAGDGSIARANAWNLLSDESLKTGFTKPQNAMLMLNELNGYYFFWKTASDKTRQFGLSAQEVLKVLPEIVTKGEDGLLSLDYGKLTPLLVEVAKEQQKQIESSKSEIINLKSQLQILQEKLGQIETLLAKNPND